MVFCGLVVVLLFVFVSECYLTCVMCMVYVVMSCVCCCCAVLFCLVGFVCACLFKCVYVVVCGLSCDVVMCCLFGVRLLSNVFVWLVYGFACVVVRRVWFCDVVFI